MAVVRNLCIIEQVDLAGHYRTTIDKEKPPVSRGLFSLLGAEEETRTPTGLPPLDPEPSVSTSSTTSAKEVVYIPKGPCQCN